MKDRPMTISGRTMGGGVLLLACCLSSVALRAQCAVRPHGGMPVSEVLRTQSVACSESAQANALCPVNRQDSQTKAYAMIKDCAETKPDGYLVVPTEKVTGVEDTKLREETYTRIWSDAWEWSKRFPRAEASWTGLAMNSHCGRTVHQLHIHVSCVSGAAREALERQREKIPLYRDGGQAEFAEIELPLASPSKQGTAQYRAVRVTDLTAQNPTVIADRLTTHARAETCSEKQSQSLVKEDVAVIGSSVKGEYFVLTYAGGFGDGGAEDLLDQTCKNAAANGGRN